MAVGKNKFHADHDTLARINIKIAELFAANNLSPMDTCLVLLAGFSDVALNLADGDRTEAGRLLNAVITPQIAGLARRLVEQGGTAEFTYVHGKKTH